VIVLDTSAIMAILLQESAGHACIDALASDPRILISAGTLAETYIVAQGRNKLAQLETLRSALSLDVIPLDAERAKRAADAHARWGRGNHVATLNFGDCFAYELATSCDCPLLFVGDDFRQTDVRCAIDGPAPRR
jgi:ribonuclease VapC